MTRKTSTQTVKQVHEMVKNLKAGDRIKYRDIEYVIAGTGEIIGSGSVQAIFTDDGHAIIATVDTKFIVLKG